MSFKKMMFVLILIVTVIGCGYYSKKKMSNTVYYAKMDTAVTGSKGGELNCLKISAAKAENNVPMPASAASLSYEQANYSYLQSAAQTANTEEYSTIKENTFLAAKDNPLSTFSIDVDTASYANMRRYIMNSSLPPADAVRIEELINYFQYDYPDPKDEHPFSITTELTECPWNSQHKIAGVAVQGKRIAVENLPPNNLTFLIDVSGSMLDTNKLPLVKKAFNMLVGKLRPEDRVAIAVYAGAAGVVLPPTSGDMKKTILSAIDKLEAGGSTAGGQGIQLAYQLAKENYNKEYNNRVILATDGDFNVGVSDTSELVKIIEQRRNEGIFLSVLGFGGGNLKDSRMEEIADKGNGNYSYIDDELEARKVFISEMGGTLFTIAKDVKIQIEFNPVYVKEYKLIGYENRMLQSQDFNNDKKDAGELGAGHTVTALYEIIPQNSSDSQAGAVDELKYQKKEISNNASTSGEMMTVKLRYKKPDEDTSNLIENTVRDEGKSFKEASENLRFAASVAEFGLVLRNSEFKGNATLENAIATAGGALGEDKEGYREEFVKLIEQADLIMKNAKGN